MKTTFVEIDPHRVAHRRVGRSTQKLTLSGPGKAIATTERWPSGATKVLKGITVDRLVTVEE